MCTVFQVFSKAAFDCKKDPDRCYDSWPPYEVMRAMSFLQPVLGSRGLIQYAWYTQFGYPGSLKPRSDPQVAARLLDLSKLSQQLRAFADHAFLRKRTSIEVVDAPTAPDGTEGVHVRPTTGHSVVWENTDANGEIVEKSLHGGMRVTCDAEKIGLNAWFGDRPWEE